MSSNVSNEIALPMRLSNSKQYNHLNTQPPGFEFWRYNVLLFS